MTVEPMVGLAPVVEEDRGAHSPFRAARQRRRLSVDDAARRAGIPADHVRWLEEGRVYRFASTNAALTASLLLAAALDVDLREARALSGLPRGSLRRGLRRRLLVVAAVLAAASALASAFALARERIADPPAAVAVMPVKQLPPPWRISVDVLNGSGDIVRTRQVASQIGALAYTIRRVGRADSFDYAQTAVYYERSGRANAIRLARTLGVITRPLPGGTNPRRLVVVVGPQRGPGQ